MYIKKYWGNYIGGSDDSLNLVDFLADQKKYERNYWNRYQALRREGVGEDDPKAPFRLAHEGTLNDGCFDNGFFYEAFHEFDNQSIEKSLVSENPLVRIFAFLDRRLGKRRLLALEESMERELPWVRAFYVIRMQAEGLMEANDIQEDLPYHRSHPFICSRASSGRNCPTATAPAQSIWPSGTGASTNWTWMFASLPLKQKTHWTAFCWRESWQPICCRRSGNGTSRIWPLKLPRTGTCPPKRRRADWKRCAPIWNWCRMTLPCCMK